MNHPACGVHHFMRNRQDEQTTCAYLRWTLCVADKSGSYFARWYGNTVAGSYGNTALSLVNAIRTHASRGASALTTINLDVLLDEQGRELSIENWRRQDLIRFSKFLQPFYEKNYTSEPKYLLFSIPIQQMAVNENYVQNPGY